jgi:chaperone required for assembly of F1-ATPase
MINPASMPLTRFANTAIDAVSDTLEDVAGDIVAYAGSDLVCYRSEGQEDLAALQAQHWDPVVAWAREALRAHFTVTKGVIPVAQPQPALFAISAALEPHEAFRLTGLHILTTLTGSALIALAHGRGFLTAEDAWRAAHVDEDYQIKLWGPDEEAAARRAHRAAEFFAASRMLSLLT